MQHLDEGTIHSWLDGALSTDEAGRVETHVRECPQCAAAVAEARGFIAASSRILTALDNAPGGVIPAAAPKKRVDPLVWRVAATMLVVAAGTLVVVRGRGSNERLMSIATDSATQLPRSTSAKGPVPATTAPEAPADALTPKGPTGNGPTVALLRKTAANSSRSDTAMRENKGLAQGTGAQAGQKVKASEIAGAAAQTVQTFAPSHAAGVVAMDAAREPEALKVVGASRKVGTTVTLYEIGPGDTVTLTESMTIRLRGAAMGATVAPIALQATGKTAAPPSKARADAAIITAPDSQRVAVVASSPPAFSAPAPSQAEMAKASHTISWIDSATGNALTLTGPMPEARLREIKIRIDRERAAAAKKNP